MSEKLLEAVQEKDAQIRVVLESKFQQAVAFYPPRPEEKREPESAEYLADVSEMSEASAEQEAIKATTRYREASAEAEKAMAYDAQAEIIEELEAIQAEHAEAHAQRAHG